MVTTLRSSAVSSCAATCSATTFSEVPSAAPECAAAEVDGATDEEGHAPRVLAGAAGNSIDNVTRAATPANNQYGYGDRRQRRSVTAT
jgi:hypothetical protein